MRHDNIILPDSLKTIDTDAFASCGHVMSLTLRNGITNIGNDAFSRCYALTTVTIPDSVTTVGSTAFAYCAGLNSVWIGNGLTNIDTGAFYACTKLNNIVVGASNLAYSASDGMLYDKTQATLLLCPEGWAGDYAVPDGVTSIGYGAFGNCLKVTSVTLPNSLTTLQGGAFSGCYAMSNVVLSTILVSIGDGAFWGNALTSVTLPGTVTTIGPNAYGFNGYLRNITIPSSVTSIGGNAFYECTKLAGIFIPGSVTNIGDAAFCWSGLTSITIPSSVTSIGTSLFNECTHLTSVGLPSSITSIGNTAFSSCSALTDITLPNTLTNIGAQAFMGCGKLTSLTIPSGVTSIGSEAFQGCQGLTSILIPEGVTGIWNFTFADCTNLASVTIGKGVTTISADAFTGCNSLKSITIPESVTVMDSYAFASCANLTAIYFQGNAPLLGWFVFQNDTVTAYYLPNTTGWQSFTRPTPVLWNPQIESNPHFGIRSNSFGFDVTGSEGITLVMEACTNLGGLGCVPGADQHAHRRFGLLRRPRVDKFHQAVLPIAFTVKDPWALTKHYKSPGAAARQDDEMRRKMGGRQRPVNPGKTSWQNLSCSSRSRAICTMADACRLNCLGQRRSRAHLAAMSLAPQPGCRAFPAPLPGGRRPKNPRRPPAAVWQTPGLTAQRAKSGALSSGASRHRPERLSWHYAELYRATKR